MIKGTEISSIMLSVSVKFRVLENIFSPCETDLISVVDNKIYE